MKTPAVAALALLCLACTPNAGNSAAASGTDANRAAPAAEAPANAPATAGPPASALAFLRGEVGEHTDANVTAAMADLDGDGRSEVIAYVSGPMLCGSGGCNSYVLTPDGDGWHKVMDASVTQLPIHLLPERTNGWHDLMVSIGGGGAAAGQVRMTFDGTSYPRNPTAGPAEPLDAPAGTVLIADGVQGQPLP